jgi:hypothetical protein
MDAFLIYQLMYLILDELNDENKSDDLIRYLTDANPYMRDGENSVDTLVYDDFRKKYYECDKKADYSYEFICDYLKNIDSYYGNIYSIFKSLSKNEYIDTCNNIINNHNEVLKKISS